MKRNEQAERIVRGGIGIDNINDRNIEGIRETTTTPIGGGKKQTPSKPTRKIMAKKVHMFKKKMFKHFVLTSFFNI